MGKKLSEMTLEELWQLFPILLKEHQDCWKEWYAEEETLLHEKLQGCAVRISHVGSTAVKSIWAKPIVDILVEVPAGTDMESFVQVLGQCGYRCMNQSAGRMCFNKGYTENGFAEKVFHLHLRRWGDNDELYFRDWLNAHEEDAKRYEAMKLSLWKRYEHDRDGYTAEKTEMVAEITDRAKKAYGGRYGGV